MYSDPQLLRDKYYKVRLNEYEDALIDALVGYTGQPKAAVMRGLMLRQAKLELARFEAEGVLRLEGALKSQVNEGG